MDLTPEEVAERALAEIQETRRLGREWLYLGYWIAESPKMLYKKDFLPQERFVQGRWQMFER